MATTPGDVALGLHEMRFKHGAIDSEVKHGAAPIIWRRGASPRLDAPGGQVRALPNVGRRATTGAVPMRLADQPTFRVKLLCAKCERRGDYATAHLIQRFGGDVSMVDLLAKLSNDCPRRVANHGMDLCGARYARETVAGP
jgi:hypothetical protein